LQVAGVVVAVLVVVVVLAVTFHRLQVNRQAALQQR
jgi:hypothetical protein